MSSRVCRVCGRQSIRWRARDAVKPLLVSAMLGVLAGCGGDPSEMRFENYRERLARSLSQPMVEPETVVPVQRPERRALRVAASDQRIGLLQFLKLNECAIWQVVGDRNSALGKVAPASQRLFSDLDFLNLAPDCIAVLQSKGETTLAQTLAEAVATKRAELPVAIWQATLASVEFEQLWHVPEKLGDYMPASDAPLATALSTLEHWSLRWLDGDYRYDEKAFENALGTLRHGNAGYWLRAAALTEAELAAANAIAQSRVTRRPLCFNGQANDQGRILLNVVQQYFVGDVQVWAASVNRVLYGVLPPHQRLESALATVQPDAYRLWVDQRNAQLDSLQVATRSHVAAIEPLLRSCSLLPASG